MKNRVLMFWIALLFVFTGTMTVLYTAGVIGSRSRPSDEPTQEVSTAKDAEITGNKVEGFSLRDQLGRDFDASAMEGKIWIASVFFVDCPSLCRMQNKEIQQLQKEFGPRGVEFVSITCDPQKDTVSRLNNYSQMYNAEPEKWHFLTGDYQEIKRVGNEVFQLVVAPQSHSDRLVLIGPDGIILGGFSSLNAVQMADLRKNLNELLAEQEQPEAAVE